MIVFDVSDIGAASRQLTDVGRVMESKAIALDGGHIAFGRDPDGNLIGLLGVNAGSVYSTSTLGAIQP